MKMLSFLLIYFALFSFFGWIIESLYRSVCERKLINSGFLYGPFIPIYGFGVIFIYLLSLALHPFPFFVEITVYTVTAVVLEYMSSYLLERIFSIKLWDYSEERFNLNGRVCLKFSFFWAILITIYLYFFQDFFVTHINAMPHLVRVLVSGVLLIYFAVDTFLSGRIYFVFSNVFRHASEFLKQGFESRDFLSNLRLPREIKEFLRAMKQFPYLAKQWNNKWSEITAKNMSSTLGWLNAFMTRETGSAFTDNKAGYDNDETFMQYASEIITHPAYLRLKEYHHHDDSIFAHNLQVAWQSYKIGKVFRANIRDLVRGALLHDFFLYDWRTEKPASGKLHAFEHPVESYNNAIHYFGTLTPVEKDIIVKHMWPLTIIPPRYVESFIVCMVDKIVATKEFSNEFRMKNNSEKENKK